MALGDLSRRTRRRGRGGGRGTANILDSLMRNIMPMLMMRQQATTAFARDQRARAEAQQVRSTQRDWTLTDIAARNVRDDAEIERQVTENEERRLDRVYAALDIASQDQSTWAQLSPEQQDERIPLDATQAQRTRYTTTQDQRVLAAIDLIRNTKSDLRDGNAAVNEAMRRVHLAPPIQRWGPPTPSGEWQDQETLEGTRVLNVVPEEQRKRAEENRRKNVQQRQLEFQREQHVNQVTQAAWDREMTAWEKASTKPQIYAWQQYPQEGASTLGDAVGGGGVAVATLSGKVLWFPPGWTGVYTRRGTDLETGIMYVDDIINSSPMGAGLGFTDTQSAAPMGRLLLDAARYYPAIEAPVELKLPLTIDPMPAPPQAPTQSPDSDDVMEQDVKSLDDEYQLRRGLGSPRYRNR